MVNEILRPAGWSAPIGYENGVAAEGRSIFVAGQIGWNAAQEFETDDLVGQFEQALRNIVAVLEAGKAGPEHLVSMTWYLTDLDEYAANLKLIGRAWRDVIGRHFPAMTVVGVSRLVERRAKVEIQAVAVVPTGR
jgi:enamine deaminase RidA (YjgF/YER057c/UK114 family)